MCWLEFGPEHTVGGVGTVIRTTLSDGTRLVLKYAPAGAALRHEAAIYESFGAQAQFYLPTYYGIFTDGYWDAIILSDEGKSLDDFQTLSDQVK